MYTYVCVYISPNSSDDWDYLILTYRCYNLKLWWKARNSVFFFIVFFFFTFIYLFYVYISLPEALFGACDFFLLCLFFN